MRGTKARIVVCDDSATIRQVIGALLRPLYDVVELESGEQALAEAAGQPPDLIISDIQMDGIDGYQLCSELKRRPALAHVPVVLLTSRTDEESKVAGLEAGADEYLSKPVRPRELLARVASLLRLRQATQALAATNHELQAAQASLVQAEKLAALGTFVAGIAHELNNPLAYVQSSLKFIGEEAQSLAGEVKNESLDEIAAAARDALHGALRMTQIVKDLEHTSRSTTEGREDVALGEEIEAAWAQIKDRAHATLEVDVAGSGAFQTVRGQLGQVLRAVLANAAEATRRQGHGRVRVAAENDAEFTRIRIADDGPGIAPEHLSRVFDPFFTTKAPGNGTGLGLSVVHGLMKSLGGGVKVSSASGGGAEVELTLPHRAPSDYPRDRELPR